MTATASIRVAWFGLVWVTSASSAVAIQLFSGIGRGCLLFFDSGSRYKTLRYGGLLVLSFAFRQNDLAICSFYSCLLLDSVASHFSLSLRHYHRLSCSRPALPRSFNEVAMSFGRGSIWRTYIQHYQVGIPGHEQYKLSSDHLSSAHSPILHEKYVRELGRNVRLRGVHPVRSCRVPRGCVCTR